LLKTLIGFVVFSVLDFNRAMLEVKMELNLGQWVVIGISVTLILAYIRGFYYNRQRAGQILAWLEEGLKTLGPVSSGDKLPGMASGGRLEVKRAAPPLKRAETMYILAPRENPLFWLFYIIQGRHDELILWVTYQSKPEQEVEIGQPRDRQLQSRLADMDKVPLSIVTGPHRLLVATEQNMNNVLPVVARSFLERYSVHIYRLAIRGNKPHLFLRANLRIMEAAPARDFFADIRELAK
jgi:hypothetical protein